MELVLKMIGTAAASRRKPMNHTLSDEEVVKRILDQGDREAYRELVRRYERPVYTLCLRTLGNAQDAEDCAQNTFLKAYSALDQFRPGKSFRSWIYRIAINGCIDARRRAQVRPQGHFEEPEPGFEIADANPGPREVASLQELRELVKEALNTLEDAYRLPLMLFYQEGLECSEIAGMLRLNIGTVKTRMRRGRLLLRELIGKRCPDLTLPEVEVL
jgi:RNA polymerase sigma-70 factor (ECF subfamily)